MCQIYKTGKIKKGTNTFSQHCSTSLYKRVEVNQSLSQKLYNFNTSQLSLRVAQVGHFSPYYNAVVHLVAHHDNKGVAIRDFIVQNGLNVDGLQLEFNRNVDEPRDRFTVYDRDYSLLTANT